MFTDEELDLINDLANSLNWSLNQSEAGHGYIKDKTIPILESIIRKTNEYFENKWE